MINRIIYIIKSTFQIKKIINKYDIDFVYINTSTIVSPTFAAQLMKKNHLFFMFTRYPMVLICIQNF